MIFYNKNGKTEPSQLDRSRERQRLYALVYKGLKFKRILSFTVKKYNKFWS